MRRACLGIWRSSAFYDATRRWGERPHVVLVRFLFSADSLACTLTPPPTPHFLSSIPDDHLPLNTRTFHHSTSTLSSKKST